MSRSGALYSITTLLKFGHGEIWRISAENIIRPTNKSRRRSVVKTRTSVREIPGTIPTIYEFSVWKESGAPPYICARALLVFS